MCIYDWLIDWLVFSANFSISAMFVNSNSPKATVLFCYRYCSSASGSRNITFLGPFPKHYWSESINSFEIKLFHVMDIVLLVPVQCIIVRYFKIKKIGLRALHDIFHSWKSNIFKYNCSMSQLLYFWFKKCMVVRLFCQI